MNSQLFLRFSGWALWSAFAGVLLFSNLMLSGCQVEDTHVKNPSKVAKETVIDARRSHEDFDFPSQPPSLALGKTVYQAQCASCHAPQVWQSQKAQQTLLYSTPIDFYLMLSTGAAPEVDHVTPERLAVLPASHPQFAETTSRDERWAAIFYTRYLAGAGDIQYTAKNGKPLDVASVFGGNCAVCHGKRGFADGPLHTGRPSSHELAAAKITVGLFYPPPANFHEYKRLYNRTDVQLFKYITQGIYPSAMPAWYGNVDKDYEFTFDEKMIWMLVRHIRTFAYTQDLPEGEPVPLGQSLAMPPSVHPTVPPVPVMPTAVTPVSGH